MEREIETDRSVVVGGDGVEEPASFERVQEFGKDKSFSTESGAGRNKCGISADETTDMDDDSDVGSSWVRSPALPRMQLEGEAGVLWATKSKEEDKGDFEHIEDVAFEDIPQLHLSPPLIAPVPHYASSITPLQQTRPPLSTFSSSSSILSSASSIKVGVSPQPTSGPRRIQSTSSLSAFALRCNHGHTNSVSPALMSQGSGSKSPYSFPSDLFNASPTVTRSRSRSKSTTFSPSNFTMTKLEEFPLPSPSIRKRKLSSGLNRGRLSSIPWCEAGLNSSISNIPSPSDVEALVDDWTRLGPANQTVVVSAMASSSGR